MDTCVRSCPSLSIRSSRLTGRSVGLAFSIHQRSNGESEKAHRRGQGTNQSMQAPAQERSKSDDRIISMSGDDRRRGGRGRRQRESRRRGSETMQAGRSSTRKPAPLLSVATAVATMAVALAALAATAGVPTSLAQPQTCHQFAPPAVAKGRKFFNALSGEYIPIKGVNYYPRPNEGDLTKTNSMDFFTEEHRPIWERDIANFVKLGINVVRIYAINPGLNHDAFMCALKAAGIYVIVGIAAECEGCAIGTLPAPACYPAQLKTRGEFILRQFSKYENVLAFSAGNEIGLYVWDDPASNAPCLKKFIRDLRSYQRSCGLREIPVGLAVVDWDRMDKAAYYNCRTDPDDDLETAGFYGLNSYQHCTGWDDDVKGYQALRSDLEDLQLPVPVIVTEFGCVDGSFPTIDGREAQRTWGQVDAMFSEEFRKVLTGGLAFEYSTERNIAESIPPVSMWPFDEYGIRNFGLGYFTPRECDDIDTACSFVEVPQFDLLRQAYARADVSSEPSMDEYEWDDESDGVASLPVCPSGYASISEFVWSSDDVDSLECPDAVAVFCPGVPGGCTTFAPAQIPPTDPPTLSPAGPPTRVPTAAPVSPSTSGPTAAPVSPTTTAAPVSPTTTGAPVAETPSSVEAETPSLPASASDPIASPSTPGPTRGPTASGILVVPAPTQGAGASAASEASGAPATSSVFLSALSFVSFATLAALW